MLALILTTRNSRFLFNSHPPNIDYGIYSDHTLYFDIHYLNIPQPFEIGIIVPIIHRMR